MSVIKISAKSEEGFRTSDITFHASTCCGYYKYQYRTENGKNDVCYMAVLHIANVIFRRFS